MQIHSGGKGLSDGKMTESRFYIIGAGTAGLTAARYIKKHAPKAYVGIFEAAAHPGGRCRSFYDAKLQCRVDNALHAILKANREALKIRGKGDFVYPAVFYDLKNRKLCRGIFQNYREIALALFNLPLEQTASEILRRSVCELFPFWNARKALFSDNKQSEYFINPQLIYADDITYGKVLKDIEGSGRATKLVFCKDALRLGKGDKVICAMDNFNTARIFGDMPLKHNPIINIHYRTSTPLTLPGGRQVIGVKGGRAQWIAVNGDIVSVIISDAGKYLNDDELAFKVWREVCRIRGTAAAFLPPYRMMKYRRATLCHDAETNARRPGDCRTVFENVFLAGDWTMKDLPCSIEAAALSGKRAAKAALSDK